MASSILEIILKTIRQGRGIPETQQELTGLERTVGDVQGALGLLGVALSAQQGIEIAQELANAARAANDAKGALTAAAKGVADYNTAIETAQAVTNGMVSKTELASSLTTIYGSKLASSAQEAAELASAGSILSGVFADAGASMDLYVRLLNSGSRELFNNFGLSQQLVAEKQKEIEATSNLSGEEARLQAIRQALIATAQQYKTAMSQDTIATAQFQASVEDAKASLGQFILPEVTAGLQNLGTALQSATTALDNMTPSARGAVEGLIDITNPMSALNSLVENFQSLTGGATEATAAMGSAASDAGGAAGEAADSYQAAASSLDAMGFSARGAVEAQGPLFRGLMEQAQAAREAAQAYGELANEQTASQAGAFGGQMDSFTQNRMLTGIRQAGDARLEAQAKAKAAEEQAAREAESNARKQAQAVTKAFSEVGSQISSAVSGAVSQSTTDIAKLLGIDESAEQRVNEGVRRMAAVATGGLANEWTQQLATQLQGVDTAQAFVNAVSGGDDAAVREEARKLALNPIVQMFDANAIASQVEQQLRAQQLQQQLNDRVNALLGEKGLQGVQAVTQQVQGAVNTTGEAAMTVGQEMTNVGASAETSAAKIGDAFNNTIVPLDTIILRIQNLNSFLRETTTIAQGAAGAIAGLNPPPAGGLPNAADKAMGGHVQQ